MAKLFENTSKINRNIDIERKKALRTRKKTEEAQNIVKEAQKIAQEMQKRADLQKEDSIRILITNLQDVGVSREAVSVRLKESYHLSPETTEKKMNLYWKTE